MKVLRVDLATPSPAPIGVGLLWRALAVAISLLFAVPATLLGLAVALFLALPLVASLVPLELARVVLTDGTRSVEMQGMAHVASPAFYRDVTELVGRRRADGWLVFYEEVQNDLGKGEMGMADLLARLGTEWKPDRASSTHPYEIIAPMLGTGLVLQDNGALLGRPGPDVRNVDLTLSELLAALPPAPSSGTDGQPVERRPLNLAEIRRLFEGLPSWVQARIRATLQIILATSTSGRYAHTTLPLAITSLREERVARAVIEAPGRNVLVLYGQVHIDAICRRLNALGPDWQIVSARTVPAF